MDLVDSSTVLWGQTLAYTFYVLAMTLVMAWFASRVTQEGRSSGVKPVLFYSFVTFLVVLGLSLHLITYYTIPWKPLDMHRAAIAPDKAFTIGVASHAFQLPSEKLLIACNDKVLFNVTSNGLTYGFGLFRQDHSMLFQMQVVPGHKNGLLWQFDKPGVYTPAQIPARRPARFRAGRARGHHAGRPGVEPDPPQHAVDRWFARARRRTRRAHGHTRSSATAILGASSRRTAASPSSRSEYTTGT